MPIPAPEPNPPIGGDTSAPSTASDLSAVNQGASDASAGLEGLAREAQGLGDLLDKAAATPPRLAAPGPPPPIPPPVPSPVPPARPQGLPAWATGPTPAFKGYPDLLGRPAPEQEPGVMGATAPAAAPVPPPAPSAVPPAPAVPSLHEDAELLRRKPSHQWGAAEWQAYQRLEGHVASQREEQYRQQAARMGQTGGAPVGPEPGTPEYARQVEQQRLDALDRMRGVAPPVPPNVPPNVPPGLIPPVLTPVMPPAPAAGLNVPGPVPSPIPAPGRPVVTSSPQEQQAVEDEFRRLQETIARTREAEDKAAAALAQETRGREEGRSTTEGFAAALSRARTDLTKLSPEMNALQAAFGVAKQLASAASPTHVQTFDRSLDLLQAKLGTYLLPAFDQLSLQIQKTARLFDMVPPSVRGGLSEYLAGGVRAGVQGLGQLLPGGSFTAGIYGATQGVADKVGQQVYNIPGLGDLARRFDQSDLGKWIGGKLGLGGDKESPLRSYAGLPPAQTLGYEQYAGSMQAAAANVSPLDLKILEEQWKNLPELAANVKDIADTMKNVRSMIPATLWGNRGAGGAE